MDIGESAGGECGRHLFWWYTPKKLTPNYRGFWTQKNVSLETAFPDFYSKYCNLDGLARTFLISFSAWKMFSWKTKSSEFLRKPPVNVSGSRRVRVVFSRRIEFNCFVIDSIHLTTFFIHLSFLCKSIGRAKLRNATRIYYLMGIFGFPVLLIFLT